ncbi:AAA family ATPase [Arthrobacter sp. zg-Y916]|uniref:AAA family ATPase n=1 Tax=Arthrobacter sp. zg-Y916 TaxID=2894190 RepID=UPI001E55D9C4|nr:AAA family ATPase [Arthrobacter sp. zg-Y916]MCC9194133.1 AAA family ATPase [Arthrobacter sp. zg-Y916]
MRVAPPAQLNPGRASGSTQASLIGRTEALRATRTSLEGNGGAVIVGPEGIGKTALANYVAGAAGRQFHVVHIRGSKVAARTDYGALNWLLSELPETALSNPVQVLRALKVHLHERSQGRRVLLVVDNAHELDALSQTVTVQLLRQSDAALLATTPDLLLCGEELVRLWSEGKVRRIDLGPLDISDAQALMERITHGRPSALAVQTVWSQAKGNPLFTSLLCRDQIAAGRIQERGGTWTLTGPLTFSGEMSDWMESWYREIPLPQRTVVELVSLCPGIPMGTLLKVVDAEPVDALEERGILKVENGESAVYLRDPLYARLVAGLIPVGRSFDLWQEILQTNPDLWACADTAVRAFAEWSCESGEGVDADVALRACAAANDAGDAEAVLKISAAVPTLATDPLLRLERARALRATQRLRAAERELHAVLAVGSAATQVPAYLELATLARSLPEPRIHTDEALERAGVSAESVSAPNRSALRNEVVAARAALAALDADLTAVPGELAALCRDRSASESVRLRARASRCQLLALGGLSREASEEATALWHSLENAGKLPHSVEAQVLGGITSTYVMCSELSKGLELLSNASRRCLDSFPGGWSELPYGIINALGGRADTALEFLLPALRQLQVSDPQDDLPMAYAAVAYCCAARQEWDAMADYLAASPDFRTRPPAQIAAVTRFFQAAAVLARRADADAAAALTAQGRRAVEQGNYPEAVLCLAAAALAGDDQAATALEAAAAKADGPAAQMWRALGTGLLQGSPKIQLDAAEALLGTGLIGLGYKTALRAREAAESLNNRNLTRRARMAANESFRLLSDANSISRRLDELSEFERDLAVRAAHGESSSALGSALHLSPRTVDWHLGRIFQKLHVSGRAELRQLLGDADSGLAGKQDTLYK